MITRGALRSNVLRAFSRCYSEGSSQNQGSGMSSGSSAPPPSSAADVAGLSNAVIEPSSGPVGPNVEPNKSGAYKVPEYFQYNSMSFYEAEVEMAQYRIPQPSALKK